MGCDVWAGTEDGPAPQLPEEADGQSENPGTHMSCELDITKGM